MCRNIHQLFNFDPPATDEEVRAAAVQYVRKVSGFNKPSRVNQESFDAAIDAVTHATRELIDQLVTTATPKDRAREAERAKLRATLRYG